MAKRHDLPTILTFALTAAVCGGGNCRDFTDFAADRADMFREFPRLENGIPSHDTFSRLFRLLDPEAVATCFDKFVDASGQTGEDVVAFDGGTPRRSFDTAAGRSPPAVVTAFASATHSGIDQRGLRADVGDGEIVAARAQPECLDLTGQPVMADAIRCRNETGQVVLDRGGDHHKATPRAVCRDLVF